VLSSFITRSVSYMREWSSAQLIPLNRSLDQHTKCQVLKETCTLNSPIGAYKNNEYRNAGCGSPTYLHNMRIGTPIVSRDLENLGMTVGISLISNCVQAEIIVLIYNASWDVDSFCTFSMCTHHGVVTVVHARNAKCEYFSESLSLTSQLFLKHIF